jgi:hypothetical protein
LFFLKMISTIDVKLSRTWGERRDVWDGWKQYMYYKSSPSSHMKVPKIEPIFQLLKSNFMNCHRKIPPIVDCYILNIYLFQRNGIFIFIAQCPMFFLTTLVWSVVLCVCPWIDYNGKNKFVFCQPLVHLHLHYRQFKQHSNWLKCCQSWIHWNLDWEHHYWPSPCLDFTTLHIEPLCFHIAYHIS